MKHVQYFLDMANDPVRTAKYAPIIAAQASAVLHYGKDANNDVGSVWYAPDSGGSVWQPEASASGLAAIVAAAKVTRNFSSAIYKSFTKNFSFS